MDRNILLVGGFLCIVAIAGCVSTPPAGTTTPPPNSTPRYDAYVFDHAGVDSPAIEGGIRYSSTGDYTRRNYVTIVESRSDADRFNRDALDDGAEAFVENTSFDDAYLVVIQEFPASSAPDYRVDRVESTDSGLHVFINDSSPGGTADITVETVLVRVHGEPPDEVVVTTETGYRFDTTIGVVTRTPQPTPEEGTPELPYVSSNASENVDDPRDIRIENRANDTIGYRLTVTAIETPECRGYTPPCGQPSRQITILERTEKLPAHVTRTIEDVVAKKGVYTIEIEVEAPVGGGSRRMVTKSFEWRVDEYHHDAVITITTETITFTADSE